MLRGLQWHWATGIRQRVAAFLGGLSYSLYSLAYALLQVTACLVPTVLASANAEEPWHCVGSRLILEGFLLTLFVHV